MRLLSASFAAVSLVLGTGFVTAGAQTVPVESLRLVGESAPADAKIILVDGQHGGYWGHGGGYYGHGGGYYGHGGGYYGHGGGYYGHGGGYYGHGGGYYGHGGGYYGHGGGHGHGGHW